MPRALRLQATPFSLEARSSCERLRGLEFRDVSRFQDALGIKSEALADGFKLWGHPASGGSPDADLPTAARSAPW